MESLQNTSFNILIAKGAIFAPGYHYMINTESICMKWGHQKDVLIESIKSQSPAINHL